MKKRNLFLSAAFLFLLAACGSSEKGNEGDGETNPPGEGTVVRQPKAVSIVCVGNSITEGYGNTSQEKAWPAQTNKLLGGGYAVLNCGVSGTTMFRNSNAPYWNTSNFTKAKAADPQILIIALGTNDADPWRWNELKGEFKTDYLAMVDEFRQGGKDPIIYVCLAPPLFGPAKAAQNKVVEEELIPLVREIAQEIGATVIDFHEPLLGASEEFPDDVHPDDAGSALMAEVASRVIAETQAIEPHVSVSKGTVEAESVAVVEKGGTVTFEPQPEDGSWQWTGTGGFTSAGRVVKLENVQQGGIYTAVRTAADGRRSVANFVVSIEGEEGAALTANVKDMDGRWSKSSFIRANPGGSITLKPEADGGVAPLYWSWTGANGFFAGTQEVNLSTLTKEQAGDYTATCTDSRGRQSSVTFTVKVEGDVVCPDLVSYINYGGWQQTDVMEVKEGDSVTFGPHPSNGEWHWEGPAGFRSDRREATVSGFSAERAGEYIGTFTNAAGCRVELVVTLKLKK